jgi:chromosome partitioning protein
MGIKRLEDFNQDVETIKEVLSSMPINNAKNLALYLDKVKELFPDKTFKTIIYRSTHLQEAPMHGQTILKYAFNSRGSKDYRELAKEIIEYNSK